MDFGRCNPFNWHTSKKDINDTIVYKWRTSGQSFFINKEITSIKRVTVDTEAETSPTMTVLTWDINGETIKATRINITASAGVKYYLKMVYAGITYYSDVIEGTSDTCMTSLSYGNSCNNTIFPFGDQPSILSVWLPEIQLDLPEVESEYETIITDKGQTRRLVRQKTINSMWFVAPKWFRGMLDGIITCDNIYLPSGAIKNITIEANEIGDTLYSEIRLKFEYDTLQEGNDCCDEVNLDEILSPPAGSVNPCEGFEVEIVNTDDTLTVTLIDEPVGTPSYRWYRNGILISTASSISIINSGDYRVDVTIDGCRATDSYFKDNVCTLFGVEVYSSGNFVMADLSNVPEGCTPSYSIILNGIEVGTSVPYEANETGTYFVQVTACECQKSGAAFIQYSSETNCDFSADIDITGSLLEADTDATSPSYLWQFEDGSGRTTVGTSSSITTLNKGIYWLTVTSGGCSKETYIYLAPSSQTGVVVLYRCTGYQFDVIGLNLLQFSNPANDLLVTINGTIHSYTSDTTPDAANLYSINNLGQLVTRSSTPFTNATIIIKVL
jgi:hypothetical protein